MSGAARAFGVRGVVGGGRREPGMLGRAGRAGAKAGDATPGFDETWPTAAVSRPSRGLILASGSPGRWRAEPSSTPMRITIESPGQPDLLDLIDELSVFMHKQA